jgi:hypothetical protein
VGKPSSSHHGILIAAVQIFYLIFLLYLAVTYLGQNGRRRKKGTRTPPVAAVSPATMWKMHYHGGDDKLEDMHHTDVLHVVLVPHALLHASSPSDSDSFFDDEHQPLLDGQHQHQQHQQVDDDDDDDGKERKRKKKKKNDLPPLWCFSVVVFSILLLYRRLWCWLLGVIREIAAVWVLVCFVLKKLLGYLPFWVLIRCLGDRLMQVPRCLVRYKGISFGRRYQRSVRRAVGHHETHCSACVA